LDTAFKGEDIIAAKSRTLWDRLGKVVDVCVIGCFLAVFAVLVFPCWCIGRFDQTNERKERE
jgi:hypothetical protein